MSEDPQKPSGQPSRPSNPSDVTLPGSSVSGSQGGTDASAPTIASSSHPHLHGATFAQPSKIGPYIIRETLGEGGMGVVYLAERLEPVRMTVALKLIKLGMDTQEVVARFESERQALALMSHPNIARVLDAGATEDGRPYFVMEYVPGEPITGYCDKHRLTNADRLALFVTVCEAVQHAHAKGLIHRDLKPSNVLVSIVDNKPMPKIIDFGVAKATNQRLTEKTLFTQHGQLVGTPEYMSPEQAEMSSLDIDNRSDIYSLGVLLYELLVGALPFDSKTLRRAGFAEIQRIIREVDPPKPSTKLSTMVGRVVEEAPKAAAANPTSVAEQVASKRNLDIKTLQRQLKGDLDWITMKAMEKDRTRRYASAADLGADISRFLTSQPVIARPPSVVYRAQKFARRRRAALILTSALVAVVVLGITLVSFSRRASIRRSNDLTNLAIKQMRQLDYAAAEKTLREAMELNSANYPALMNFATVKRFEYDKTKDSATVDAAIKYLDQSAAAEPTRAEPWNIKGVFLRNVGRNADAITAFKKGIDADKSYFATYVSLANTYVAARDFDNAEKTLLLADSLPGTADDPRPWMRWYNLAAIQLALGKPEAGATIKKALDAGTGDVAGRKNPDVWVLYAKTCLLSPAAKDYSAARDALIRANDDPTKTSWKIQRYKALAELRNANAAAAADAAQRDADLKDPVEVYPQLIAMAAAKAQSDQSKIQNLKSKIESAWPQNLQKDKLQATIDGGLIWVENIAELDALKAEVSQ